MCGFAYSWDWAAVRQWSSTGAFAAEEEGVATGAGSGEPVAMTADACTIGAGVAAGVDEVCPSAALLLGLSGLVRGGSAVHEVQSIAAVTTRSGFVIIAA